MAKSTPTHTSDDLDLPDVDSGVGVPPKRRPQADSFTSRLVELDLGETEARAVRFPDCAHPWPDIQAAKEQLKSTVTGQVRNARKRLPDARYTLAMGDFRAPNGDTMVIATVTRIE
ncbi:hypothetical protein P3D58_19215 [Pseudomonas aeruginosa]